MATFEIKTATIISATPRRVWEILTDFEKYPDWNPFITSLEGNPSVGNTVKIRAGGMNFEPEILACEVNQELRWIGKLLFKGLFDGEHSFLITDNGDGTVTFQQNERFTGALVALFKGKLGTETRSGFEQMNRRLKELAEKG
ncbi:polyketide cyclase [Lewinellaceae bacterium SD302]|nr:polyketide cyclase [Lewinellaceae bacterium SD302]